MRVFVTGGAGYVGSLLIDTILGEGASVCVYDRLMYGPTSLFTHFVDPSFRLVKGDIRDREALAVAIRDYRPDLIIHLAAIVGYPACARDPQMAIDVNMHGTRVLADVSGDVPIVFASTGSAYGKVEGICDEESPCEPLSLYGQTKRAAEVALLERGNVVVLRFATAFGLSHRLRLDLLPNDFTYQAVHNRQLIVYEPEYRRTFIHVRDMARSFIFSWENFELMRGGTYNVGGEHMNLTKRALAEAIQQKVPYYVHYADVGKDMDQRDYEVSYAKIRAVGFRPEITMDHGLDELIAAFQAMETGGSWDALRAQQSLTNVAVG